MRGGALSAKGLAPDGLNIDMDHAAPEKRWQSLQWQLSVRYDRKADSGNVIAMNFCAHCYGWLWNDPPLLPGISAGTDAHFSVRLVLDHDGRRLIGVRKISS